MEQLATLSAPVFGSNPVRRFLPQNKILAGALMVEGPTNRGQIGPRFAARTLLFLEGPLDPGLSQVLPLPSTTSRSPHRPMDLKSL